jgi:RNA polymerase sigma-70 factor, ECF subfamily
VHQKELAEQCKKRVGSAERKVFELFAPMLRGVCFRYADNPDEAEDMLQEGFIRIFDTVNSFSWKGEGSFTAWMRQVMVNNAINYYKKKKRLKMTYVESDAEFTDIQDEEINEDDGFGSILSLGITQSDLLAILMEIPEIYRVVFNLAVIDGLKHKEIGEMLGIDESSSRSRLLRSKKLLKEALYIYIKTLKAENPFAKKQESLV